MSSKKDKTDKGSPFFALKEIRDRMQKEAEAAKTAPAAKGKPGSHASMGGPPPPQKGAARASAAKSGTAAAHEDEVESFHRMMLGTAPMPTDKPARAGTDTQKGQRAAEIAVQARREAEEARDRLSALASGGVRFEVTDDGAHIEGKRLDAPPELLRKLRRGILPVDVTLDLHGLRAAEAEESLFAFLTKARTAGERVARVIHGKGQHSPGNTGVLRGELGAWLSQGRASRIVVAFATSPADLGGEGATLVALAR